MSKADNIAKTFKETKQRRQSQDVVVYELKIINNKLSKTLKEKLNRLFLEAKWFYNYILSKNDVFNFDSKIKQVQCKTTNGFEDRELKTIGSQIKQEILKRIQNSIKSLSSKKKKGNKVGKLKFKSEFLSIPLKQFNTTYKIKGNKILIQGIGKIKVKGINQISKIKEKDFANANLIKRNNDIYLKITCFKEKTILTKTNNAIGIDFGIKDSMVFSNGIKIDTKIPLSRQVLKEHKKFSKKIKNSKNHNKQLNKLKKSYEKITNKRKDTKNKIISYLKNNYDIISVQNENIKGWHSGLFGKQIQQSTIGGIIEGIKKLPHTTIVDRYYPSTQECPNCLTRVKQDLSKRIYKCKCGYVEDRDIHSARNILFEGLQIVPTVRRDLIPIWNKKPVEIESTKQMYDYFKTFCLNSIYESGSPML
ncbi:MAG: transposase [Candidatus Babeliales bacterium]